MSFKIKLQGWDVLKNKKPPFRGLFAQTR